MRILSTAMVFIMTIGAAAAETACYERLYDAAHMQKHKLQEVTKIRLKLDDNGEELSGDIQAGFRELPDYLTSSVRCSIGQRTTMCRVDQGGGSFEFVSTAKGIKLTNTSQIRFGGIDDGVVIGREVEHQVFALVKAACSE